MRVVVYLPPELCVRFCGEVERVRSQLGDMSMSPGLVARVILEKAIPKQEHGEHE